MGSVNACLVFLIFKLDIQLVHGIVYHAECLDYVVENYRLPFQFLGLAETSGVDQLHLLQNGRLAGLARAFSRQLATNASLQLPIDHTIEAHWQFQDSITSIARGTHLEVGA